MSKNNLQAKSKNLLELAFPTSTVIEEGNTLKMRIGELNWEALDSLSIIEGMHKDLRIKRSGSRLLIVVEF